MTETHGERIRLLTQADLYPVTSEAVSRGHQSLDIVDAILEGGCRMFQLREKELTKRQYYDLAKEVRRRTQPRNILMICNDHLDVALALGADGVHLGTDDLPLGAARRLAPDLILGASTHSLAEALGAQEAGADYVNIGPIFPTATKEGASIFLGPDAIGEIAPRLDIPFTVMGGINLGNVDQVLVAGARRVAVVSAVTAAPDPQAAIQALRTKILAAGA